MTVVWQRTPAAAPERRIRVRDDCTGSYDCCAEIHLERFHVRDGRLSGLDAVEVHLTPLEVRSLRAALTRCLDDWAREHPSPVEGRGSSLVSRPQVAGEGRG